MESSSKGDEKRLKATKRLFRTTDSLKPLLNLVLLLLDLRRRLLDISEPVDIEEGKIQELEDQALKVILKFVYRLNHGNFKPMFLRIIEWATEDFSKGSATSINRCMALWNFLYLLGSDLEASYASSPFRLKQQKHYSIPITNRNHSQSSQAISASPLIMPSTSSLVTPSSPPTFPSGNLP